MLTAPGMEKIKNTLQPAYHRYRGLKGDFEHSCPETKKDLDNNVPAHVLLVIVDALRPDIQEAIPLETTSAIAPAPWTFPSVTSILTGEYPHKHGSTSVIKPDEDGPVVPTQTDKKTIVEAMEASGRKTGSFTGFLTPHLVLEGWFCKHRTWHHAAAETVITEYLDWRSGYESTFGYIHLEDLHEPIEPPERYIKSHDIDTSIPNLATWDKEHLASYGGPVSKRYRDERLKLYRAAASYIRDSLVELLDKVENDTLVIITADHGEAHWEQVDLAHEFTHSTPAYGAGHGGTPWDTVARVPLGLHDPDGKLELPTRGGWPSLVDLPRTLSERLGIRGSFRHESWDDEISADRSVLCEGALYGSERKAVYRGKEKLIYGPDDNIFLYGTVDADEGESLNRVRNPPEDLTSELPESSLQSPSRDVGSMVDQQLKALGYD